MTGLSPCDILIFRMSTLPAQHHWTPEELLDLPDEKSYEVVNGQLVERTMGLLSDWVAAQIISLLQAFVMAKRLGWVFPSSTGYQCFDDDPGKLRKPDASFIRADRLPRQGLSTPYARIPPDLAVEVVSPNDKAYEIDEKVDEYLRAGVREVWVINPERRNIRIHRADGSLVGLRESDILKGGEVIPGFSCRVADLFPPEPAAKNP